MGFREDVRFVFSVLVEQVCAFPLLRQTGVIALLLRSVVRSSAVEQIVARVAIVPAVSKRWLITEVKLK